MRLSLTCECVCIAQVDSELTSFVTALSEVALSETVSTLTDPTYGPDSNGVGESEISSLTNPTFSTGSREEAAAVVAESSFVVADAIVVGVGDGANGGSGSDMIAGALRAPYADDQPTSGTGHDDDSASWTYRPSHLQRRPGI